MDKKFWELENVIWIEDQFWRTQIRPQLLKSKYAPQNANEDINDFVIYNDGKIILPKYFWHTMYPLLAPKIPNLKEHIILPKILPETKIDVDLREGVEPREYQKSVIEQVLKMYEEKKHVRTIIRGTTGFGKTFVAVYIIAKLKLKPLIIVHNETLYKQWQEALLNFLDIDKDRIGTVQGSNIEKIKKALEKDIVIVKIQSLLSQIKRISLEELYDMYKEISLVIMDESHITSAAQKFGKVTAVFRTPNIIGLSATPYRKGIHQLIMDTNISPNLIESDHKNLIPEVVIKTLYCPLSPKAIHSLNYARDYVRKLGVYNKAISETNCFVQKIANDIESLVKEERHILAIMANNTLVKNLVDELKSRNIEATSFIAENREIDKTTQVIVSNNQMSSTGFSIDSLDTLILANSNIGKVLLVQSIGRIVRAHENKKQPKAFIYMTYDFAKYINDKYEYIISNNIRSEYGDTIQIRTEYEEIEEESG